MPIQEYSPEQAALLPLHVRDVLREDHLVFLISAVVDATRMKANASRDWVLTATASQTSTVRTSLIGQCPCKPSRDTDSEAVP